MHRNFYNHKTNVKANNYDVIVKLAEKTQT